MAKSKEFKKWTRPNSTLRDMKKSCFVWLVATVIVNPRMTYKDLDTLDSFTGHELYAEVILALVEGVCQHLSPPEEGWDTEDILTQPKGKCFRDCVLRKIKVGLWSIEEVNSISTVSLSKRHVAMLVGGLWFEFAVICMYFMHDFPSWMAKNKSKIEKEVNWVVTPFQKNQTYWTQMKADRLFPPGGRRLTQQVTANGIRGHVISEDNHTAQEHRITWDYSNHKETGNSHEL